jgi:hypothetical protein
MNGLITRLVGIVVLVVAAHFGLKTLTGARFMEHWNACNAELKLPARLAIPDDETREKALDEFRACITEKSNVVDRMFFGRKDIDAAVDAVRRMNQRSR